jgi:hypothetical protein
MVALTLIAYAIALLLGETMRPAFFPLGSPKHKLYSGLFIFNKLKLDLSPPLLLQACPHSHNLYFLSVLTSEFQGKRD